MPAISFSGETSRGTFYDLILKEEKTQTCRKPRKRPIQKGDTLILYWKQRIPADKKPIHKIAEAHCTSVTRMQYGDFCFDEGFARMDGFKDSLEMQEWFGEPLECWRDEYDVIEFKLKVTG